MSIWGHERVLVEKDRVAKVWRVMTTKQALLVTIPWADAFKEFPHAKDYQEAVLTCQSDPDMRLTAAERAEFLRAPAAPAAPAAPPTPETTNVLVVDFKRKKRLT